MAEITADLVAAQRAADNAWAELEAYRKSVDEQRRASAQPAEERHRSPVLRPWTEEEDTRFAELRAEAVAASERRRDALKAAGVVSTYDTESQLRAAARGNAA